MEIVKMLKYIFVLWHLKRKIDMRFMKHSFLYLLGGHFQMSRDISAKLGVMNENGPDWTMGNLQHGSLCSLSICLSNQKIKISFDC